MSDDEGATAYVRAAMEASDLPEGSWAVGSRTGDGPLLLLQDGEWVAGFYERGRFYPEFTEADWGVAVVRFTEWVKKGLASTEASAAATDAWLRRTGRERP